MFSKRKLHPKPLQNSPKTTSAVTAVLLALPLHLPLSPPPILIRRHHRHFWLVNLTWVWSKVVVA